MILQLQKTFSESGIDLPDSVAFLLFEYIWPNIHDQIKHEEDLFVEKNLEKNYKFFRISNI